MSRHQSLATCHKRKSSLLETKKFAIDGDENSKYFHVVASNTYMKNKIAKLEINGSVFTSHEHKTEILTNYYKQLLGHNFNPTWNFSLHTIYPHTTPGLSSLADPVTENEITDVFFQMKKEASLRPDGFGPGFYRKCCHKIKPKMINLFQNFF
jgi:hypothetical protein